MEKLILGFDINSAGEDLPWIGAIDDWFSHKYLFENCIFLAGPNKGKPVAVYGNEGEENETY